MILGTEKILENVIIKIKLQIDTENTNRRVIM